MTDSQSRRRWVTLGEIIALLALVVSAAGLWLTWKSNGEDKPTRVVEQRILAAEHALYPKVLSEFVGR